MVFAPSLTSYLPPAHRLHRLPVSVFVPLPRIIHRISVQPCLVRLFASASLFLQLYLLAKAPSKAGRKGLAFGCLSLSFPLRVSRLLTLWIGFGLAVLGGVVPILIYLGSGARPKTPNLEGFLAGEGPAYPSPPLFARLRSGVDSGRGQTVTEGGN